MRTKANVEDLAAFFDAHGRADAVEEWLTERERVLRTLAAHWRAAQSRLCGTALRAMRDRGQSVREIAGMAGLTAWGRSIVEEMNAVVKRRCCPQWLVFFASAPARLLFVVYGRKTTRIDGNHVYLTGNVTACWTGEYEIYWHATRTVGR
jgi:hypothetical protein